MPTGYHIKDQESAYYLTFQLVFWIDIFTRQIYRDIIIDSFRYCQREKSLEIYAFVIMSNHVHLLVRSSNSKLSATIRDFKKFTSKRIIETIINGTESRRECLPDGKAGLLNMFSFAAKRQNKTGNYQVWTHKNHAIEVYSNKFIEEKVEYIHQNPVRSGIVQKPDEYIYSSAKYYADEECLLDIIPVSFRWKTVS